MAPRKLILALVLFMLPSLAYAGCSVGALPFILQNNTVADATQVDADFNQITSGINSNCAAAGANNDITSLSALTTPITPAQGGTTVFAGGFTGGSPNAQTLTVPGNFTLTTGNHITGFFSAANTAFMTMSVNGGAIVGVLRRTQTTVTSTVSGEALVNQPFDMVYNGSAWVLISDKIMVGSMLPYAGNAAPPGYLLADGSSFTCTTFQDLCNVIGTEFGGSAANPNLPDTRGRVLSGLDNYNSYGSGQGAAGRLNNIMTGCGTAFTIIGVTCANAGERHFQQINELAVHNHGITDPGHGHNVNDPGHGHLFSNSVVSTGSGSNGATNIVGSNLQISGTQTNTTGITNGTNVTNITINNTGSGAAMPIVNPNLGVLMIIRF